MDGLDDDQRRAVHQLQEISNTTDDEVAVGVLNSVDWDIQKATELIFGSAPIPSSSQAPEMQTFDIDDSQQGELDAQPRRRPTTFPPLIPARSFLSLVTFPIHILSSIFKFVFGFLRIPIPQFRFLNFYRTRQFRPSRIGGGPDRWLRELEEETGAISISRLKQPRGVTSSLNTEPGQSSLTSRRTNGQTEDGRKLLPDFSISTYEEMLRLCQREMKIGCIILVSEEHDDVPEFKRSTLTDPAFVKTLCDNDIIVWGGDVRDQEAWSAAERLQATSYPFVAFVALQPRRSLAASSSSSSRNSSPPSLTVLSRHQGKCIPLTGPTSAQTLTDHIERQLLPRVTPFLNRLISSHRERERDRYLRDEQDRAFQMAAQRDKERIESKMAEEKAAVEAKRLAEEETRLASQRRARETEIARVKENDRMDWRRWTRRVIVSNGLEDTQGSLRIAIRLPAGGRVIHQFSQSSTLTSLYAFVDSQLIPDQYSASDDPVSLPQQRGVGEQALEDHICQTREEYWGFNVALAYPRTKIPWKAGTKLSDVNQLKGGGQVVVEFTSIRPRHRDEDDGYHTEDSE